MNKITVYGRLSTEVELRNVNGRNVANFGVAARNKHKNNNTNDYDTNFYRAQVWGASADAAAKLLKKGHRVVVAGDLVVREYVGNDQKNHTALEIYNAEFGLVETKAESGAAPAVPDVSAPSFTPVDTSGSNDELPF